MECSAFLKQGFNYFVDFYHYEFLLDKDGKFLQTQLNLTINHFKISYFVYLTTMSIIN